MYTAGGGVESNRHQTHHTHTSDNHIPCMSLVYILDYYVCVCVLFIFFFFYFQLITNQTLRPTDHKNQMQDEVGYEKKKTDERSFTITINSLQLLYGNWMKPVHGATASATEQRRCCFLTPTTRAHTGVQYIDRRLMCGL